MDIRIDRTLEHEAAATWDADCHCLFDSSRFLEVTRTTHQDLEHRYIRVLEDGQTIARLYGQVITFRGESLKNYIPEGDTLVRKTVQQLVSCVLDQVEWRILAFGNVFITGDQGQCWHPSVAGARRARVMQRVVDRMVHHDPDLSATLITDLSEADRRGLDPLTHQGFRPFEVEPDMVLDIPRQWASFDDYLGAMTSKYRVRARKTLRESGHLEVSDLNVDGVRHANPRLMELYEAIIGEADFHLARINHDYLPAMKAAFPDRFRVWSYSLKGRVVGFISGFLDGDTLHAHLVGIDYDVNKQHHVYRRILLDLVRLGIEAGMRQVHFGRTAGGIKTSYGAHPVPVHAMLRHHQPLSNLSVKALTRYLKPEPFTVRHPFKAGAA